MRACWPVAGGVLALAALLTGCAPQAAVSQDASFDGIATRILSNCTTRSCHGATGARGGLVLTADQAYDSLVNVPAANDVAHQRGKLRVVPGNPDASFLLQKLVGPAADEGSQMPLVGPTLSREDLATIRAWIASGAPRHAPSNPTMNPNPAAP